MKRLFSKKKTTIAVTPPGEGPAPAPPPCLLPISPEATDLVRALWGHQVPKRRVAEPQVSRCLLQTCGSRLHTSFAFTYMLTFLSFLIVDNGRLIRR